MAIQKKQIATQSQKEQKGKGDETGVFDDEPNLEQSLSEPEKDIWFMGVLLSPEQKLILSQFTDHTKGLTIKEICENPENEVDMPFDKVYTTLQELTYLKLLRIGKAGDTAKWFITYAGIKTGGVAGSPWP
jgi:hypothetical protein